MSPLGETLQRARQAKGITYEDAERVTRIPRKYLEALELENFSILPAPVYARGFLRSYAGYLGLNPNDLLPFFPVGHVEEPKLEPLPAVRQTHTWNMSSLIAMAVVGGLIMLVILLYAVGRESSSSSFVTNSTASRSNVIVPPAGDSQPPITGPATAIPDLTGQSEADAIAIIERSGASYVLVGVRSGDVPAGQVISQSPAAGDTIGAGSLVTLNISR
jgi:cytoskeletal protein RodZ